MYPGARSQANDNDLQQQKLDLLLEEKSIVSQLFEPDTIDVCDNSLSNVSRECSLLLITIGFFTVVILFEGQSFLCCSLCWSVVPQYTSMLWNVFDYRGSTSSFPSVLWRCWLGQEGHPASNNLGCWFVGDDDMTGALCVQILLTCCWLLFGLRPKFRLSVNLRLTLMVLTKYWLHYWLLTQKYKM